MTRLANKICIITGSGSGIGRASALMFAREGATVIVADIRAEAAEMTAQAVVDAGGSARAMTVDVGEQADLEHMIGQTVADFGRIDVLFNNALYVNQDHAMRDMDFLAFDPDIFLANLRVNVLGAVLASKLAIPHMLERGAGSIISTSSGSSMGGDITAYSYGSSKAALNWFVQAIAATYGKRGIRSNAILPGPTQTPAKLQWSTPEMDRLFLEVLNTPFIGEPEDIAAMALFLASDESRYVNGMLYPVDGGQSCTVPFISVTRALSPG
ncbi:MULTISPECIES: SDR family NAD(P)-dependent oxidoreductase [Sphingobium]|uniref:SDR family oxidoreductase n=1 Tax=Sphingobium fuliginis ATCC 27551 TaxID=1208342 RepID=A0A5B8CBS7_SPHSA|nr:MULTISPECIES: SDR family oxidoreductase [Sphingobium]OAP32239.1 alcohol dehydrogenase [Sphingobium sp. 20006FA]AJR25351.1 alcohol dehydrogenase [Sphingobium sp. YBL2]KXU33027.1 alcohol dehydrogenase [Sphingobium sp. AM]KYC33972.1 alcohol dehydrogenase [Sphingobium sp. 22B]QDC36918.1 SDR family oxidoreductase [Sphingobium fuliginis ATCC 27551]